MLMFSDRLLFDGNGEFYSIELSMGAPTMFVSLLGESRGQDHEKIAADTDTTIGFSFWNGDEAYGVDFVTD